MSLLDRLAVLTLGAGICVAVYVGAQAAGEARSGTSSLRNPHGVAMDVGNAARSGIDPLRPPGLPEGAAIDPETGLMIGLDLVPEADESVLEWRRLKRADDMPADGVPPADLTALDGERVVMAGFLMPLYALRDIRAFALVGSHFTCCFARPPGLGGQVIVTLSPKADSLGLTIRPLVVRGTFRVRPQHLYEGGKGPLISLFEIQDARAAALE